MVNGVLVGVDHVITEERNMESTMTKNIKAVIEKLMVERGADNSIECQVMLSNGAQLAGAMVKTEFDGLYRMVAIMQKQGANGKQGLESVDMYIPVELMVLLTIPTAEKDKPRIVTPGQGGGRIIG